MPRLFTHSDSGLQMLDRRHFNQLAARLGIGIALTPLVLRGASAEAKMSYYTWAGYEVPQLHEAYTKKYGAEPDITFFGDEDEALTKIRAGFLPSLAHPCSSSTARWRDAGVLGPIDVSRLKNWPDLLPQLTGIPGTNAPDQTIWIPFDWGSNSIVYRTDKVDPKYIEENSWQLLFDDRYAGQIAMWSSIDGAIAMSAAILGIKDTANVTDQQFADIRDLLTRQKKLIRFYWDSETVAEEALASGEVVASYLWSASYERLKKNGVPVGYMLHPKEGLISFACGIVMLKNGKGDDQAKYDFLDAMISPEAGKFLVEDYGYGHSNRKTYDLVSDEVLQAQGLTRDVSSYIATTSFFQSWAPELRSRYIQMFNEIRAMT
jgi:spermidine/putrescine transport system substrate-binding protein